MEKQVSTLTMVGIVIIALAVVIGSGFAIFASSKSTANDGVVGTVEMIDTANRQWLTEFNDKTIYGTTLINVFSHVDEGVAIFINTRQMNNNINLMEEHYVLQFFNNCYVNYGCIFDFSDDGYKRQIANLAYYGDSELIQRRDSCSLKTDKSFRLDDYLRPITDDKVSGVYTRGSAEFIELNAQFETNLIYGPNGDIVAIIAKQIAKNTASDNVHEPNTGYHGDGTYISDSGAGGNIPSSGGGSGGGGASGSIGGGSLSDPSTPEGNIPQDEFKVSVVNGDGSGTYKKGTICTVTAKGHGEFIGWYVEGNLLSSSETYDFKVTRELAITAKYK